MKATQKASPTAALQPWDWWGLCSSKALPLRQSSQPFAKAESLLVGKVLHNGIDDRTGALA